MKELFSTGQEMNPTIMPKSALIAEYYDKRVLVFGVSFDMGILSILSGCPDSGL